MPVEPLSPERLRRICHHEHFDFETTAELNAVGTIIGQPRGTRAIEFGISIQSRGYNMFVLGESGTGRTTAIHRFLREKTGDRPVPPDWVYVNNFTVPYQPRAIALPAGQGRAFQSAIHELVHNLQDDLPKAFNSDLYREALEALTGRVDERQEALFNQLAARAAEQGFGLVGTPSGPAVAPIQEGKVLTPEEFQQLPLEQQQQILAQQEALNKELQNALEELQQVSTQVRSEMKQLEREVAVSAVSHYFKHWQRLYQNEEEVLLYLAELEADVYEHLQDFRPAGDDQDEPPDLSRYQVNLFVDNSETTGAPVIVEANPTLHNLIGRVEYEMRYGVMSTHFTNLKAGSLHHANGGYLIVSARDLLRHSSAWEALKRAIKSEQILLQSPERMDGAQVLATSLDPEPIPFNVKIILLGSPGLYYWLYDEEEDFGELFKVKADFDSEMPRDDQHEYEYALFIANRCREEGLRHFDRPAVEKVVEYGARLAQHQDRLSTRFGEITDLVREASFWSGQNGRDIVTAADVQTATNERIYRANRIEERMREDIVDEQVFITTTGTAVGQVNGLSVLDMGDYAFGQPGRITARTYLGEDGVINIEREVELAGPIHNKGLLTLVGYLGGHYALDHPLSLSASLTFEQNYGSIDGDSASAAELLALLSSLSNIPIRQGVAVTGSVNQWGEIQPVGGVTEKVEGFYKICQARGLTGDQGVVIPAANVPHLMLNEEVVQAASEGRFHIWAVRTIDEAMELLTGKPAGERDTVTGDYPPGSIHAIVQERLRHLAHQLKAFDRPEEDEEQA